MPAPDPSPEPSSPRPTRRPLRPSLLDRATRRQPPPGADASPASSTGAAPRPGGLLAQLAPVIGVAFLLATLFTAWTPGQEPDAAPLPHSTAMAAALQPTPSLPPGAPTPTLRNPRLVGIVAGHWKNDSGAVCPDGLKEVELNLRIASLVQKLLSEQGYTVELLSEFDPKLSNYEAAALVSIHNDSCDFVDTNATGFKVAAAMATRHPERAAQLTACLRSRYRAQTGLEVHSTSVTPDMTQYHAFGEISDLTTAAIIETGFMNLDRQLLTEQTDKVAQGVANGVLCFLRDETVTPPTSVVPPAAVPSAVPTP
ncbi:MAG: N-acetylmuramoyl-L-alanine amidase [Chloroflexota bacterium]